jgi:hypothetical protein
MLPAAKVTITFKFLTVISTVGILGGVISTYFFDFITYKKSKCRGKKTHNNSSHLA